ncbi:MAG: hypothetical protein FJ146_01155 [Deltaproteobacteria bacterium]|nr:hypothetical protein [Deltaproteobacteria bacterium]
MKKHWILPSVAIVSVAAQLVACGMRDAEDLKKIVQSYGNGSGSESSQTTAVQGASTTDGQKPDPASQTTTAQTSQPPAAKPVDPTTQSGSGTQVAQQTTTELMNRQHVSKCLKSWNGKAPFTEQSQFRTLVPGVMVFGIGTAIDDTQKTVAPELILIPAGVNVLGTAKYRLLNPNGWYCLAATVNVLGNLSIDADAKAQIADSSIDVMVAGKQNVNATGYVTVSVGGSITLKIVN